MKRHRKRRKGRSAAKPDRASNPIVAWLHGLAALGDERWDEAIVAFKRFLKMDAKPQDRPTAYYNLGACYLALERYDDALATLDKVERYAPDDPEAMHSRG